MKNLRGYFLSDLHLFSRRSQADRFSPQIHALARQAHTMVLGGDIFDFRWSTHPSLEHSVEEAIAWVEHLIESHPMCGFYYLLGNHDAHPLFVSELDRLAFRQMRLHWQPHILRLGNCVFLHGDVVDGEPDHSRMDARRRAGERRNRPPRLQHWLYDAVVQARLHRVAAHLVKRQVTVLRKLNHYLTDQGLDATSGVTDVYFGHTHREMDGVRFHGLTYHNGGAMIKGLSFRIVETRLEHPARPY